MRNTVRQTLFADVFMPFQALLKHNTINVSPTVSQLRLVAPGSALLFHRSLVPDVRGEMDGFFLF